LSLEKLKLQLEKFKLVFEKKQYELAVHKSNISRELDIEALKDLWQLYQKNGNRSWGNFLNACLFSSIMGRDLELLSKRYILTKDKNEKNLFGRLLSMTIIEYLDDINNLLGNKLRKELIQNKLSDFSEQIKQINKRFSLIKKKNNTELRRIRNNASAHKTKDSLVLLDFTREIEIKELGELASTILKLNTDFTKCTVQIFNKMNANSEKALKKMKNAM